MVTEGILVDKLSLRVPDMGEDLFLRQHLLAILHEIAQQLILNFAEVDLFLPAEHLRRLPVDRDAATRHRRARRQRLQNAANARL